ncbi:hypothetical protein Tco_0054115 [Tanacetum coccineum]
MGFEDFDSKVMVISVISVSSDSSEDSIGTPAGRVILLGTIPTTILDTTPVITLPTTQTDTIVIPTESDPSKDPSSDHIPPLPAILPFLSLADDTTDSDTPDTPPSLSCLFSWVDRTTTIFNGLGHMMTARKRLDGLPLSAHLPCETFCRSFFIRLFFSNDSARDSSSDSSSEASSDFYSDASSDSSSRNIVVSHSSPDLTEVPSAGPSRK